MSLKARIIMGFLLLFGAAFYYIADSLVKEMRPRYLEAVEESLNETAHTLASLVETQTKEGRIDTSLIESVFRLALDREFSARIFDVTKTRVGLDIYITDEHGTVLFDSRGDANIGKDFSRWNDVYNTLRGRYGARSTRSDPADPLSSMLYVAAPILRQGRIAGVLTVIKPQDSVSPFIDIAKKKLISWGLVTAAALAILALILSFWISRPLTRLGRYVRDLRINDSARLPAIGAREIRELGEEFQSLWEKLKGKQYIEEYVQSLTHELKSPLTSIRGSSELLMEDMPDEQRQTFQHNILRETRRMEEIIGRMMELSSLENRRELRDPEPIPLDGLVREILESYAGRIESKSITIENHLQAGLVIRGERFLLYHAIANLLDNALKFTPPVGRITITASVENGRARIAVIDRGPGIPDYAASRILDRFYSLPDPETGKKSTGLGLPFVREAVALHGGTLSITNRPEGGVAAIIIIPL